MAANQLLFLAEDAMAAVLSTATTLPIHLGASADTIEPPCIAIRAESADPRPIRMGNFGIPITVEIRSNPHNASTPRATLRLYAAAIGDALESSDLATALSSAISGFSCDGAQVERVSQQADGLHHLYAFQVLLACRASD